MVAEEVVEGGGGHDHDHDLPLKGKVVLEIC